MKHDLSLTARPEPDTTQGEPRGEVVADSAQRGGDAAKGEGGQARIADFHLIKVYQLIDDFTQPCPACQRREREIGARSRLCHAIWQNI